MFNQNVTKAKLFKMVERILNLNYDHSKNKNVSHLLFTNKTDKLIYKNFLNYIKMINKYLYEFADSNDFNTEYRKFMFNINEEPRLVHVVNSMLKGNDYFDIEKNSRNPLPFNEILYFAKYTLINTYIINLRSSKLFTRKEFENVLFDIVNQKPSNEENDDKGTPDNVINIKRNQ